MLREYLSQPSIIKQISENDDEDLGNDINQAHIAQMAGITSSSLPKSSRVMEQTVDYSGNVVSADYATMLHQMNMLQSQLAQLQSNKSAERNIQRTNNSVERYGRDTTKAITRNTSTSRISCFKCGKQGHMKYNCPLLTINDIICHTCQGHGHISRDCPTRTSVTGKRKYPQGASIGQERPYKAVTFDPKNCNYPPRGTGVSTDSRFRAATATGEQDDYCEDFTMAMQAQVAAAMYLQQEQDEGPYPDEEEDEN